VNFLFKNNGKLFIYHHEKPWKRNITEESSWLNVQNVVLTFRRWRRHGKWLVDQTNRENGCNWKSGCINAQRVTPSEKCWV